MCAYIGTSHSITGVLSLSPLPSPLRTTCGCTVKRKETSVGLRWTLRRTRDKWRGASRSMSKVHTYVSSNMVASQSCDSHVTTEKRYNLHTTVHPALLVWRVVKIPKMYVCTYVRTYILRLFSYSSMRKEQFTRRSEPCHICCKML